MADVPALSSYSSAVTLDYDTSETSLNQALLDAGLDPAEWIITDAQLAVGKSSTLKVKLSPQLVRPARLSGPSFTSAPYSDDCLTHVVAILSDQQCPYHDPYLHDEACSFLARNNIDTLIVNGDTFDFPSVSSYDANPRFDTHINASIDAGYQVLRDYAIASCAPTRIFIPGNHEQRLQKYLGRNAQSLIGLRRATDDADVLTIPYLARLDELGYEFRTGTYNDWPQADYWLTNNFVVKHGWLVRSGSGATARAHVEALGVSVLCGHTHRLAMVPITKLNNTWWGVEGGTMTTVEGGLGYTVPPDWQPGFTVVRVYDNSECVPTLIPYSRASKRLLYNTFR